MELSKKRKTEENGVMYTTAGPNDGVSAPPSLSSFSLSPQDARRILEPFTKEQLLDVLQTVVVRDVAVLDAVRSIADSDPAQRKLFIRGIGWETTTEKLRSIFSSFGELEEAIVITDKNTGKSKGYGFVTFKHIDGTILALKEPSKKIDGRITVAQLAAARDSNNVDVSPRKIYVGNVPFELSSERLLSHFSSYGEIEEGPLGFDKQSGKQKGFAFFVYKTEEGARNSIVDPMKNIDGHQVTCKMATDGKKGKGGGPQGTTGRPGDTAPPLQSLPSSMNSGYGMPGGIASYGGYSTGRPLPHQNPPMNSSVSSTVGGVQSYGSQAPPSYGGASGGGYGGGGYGSGGYSGSQYGSSAASGDYAGYNNYGSSITRMPPSSGTYPESGNYSLSSSSYPTPMQQPPAGARGPPGQMYQSGPPYY